MVAPEVEIVIEGSLWRRLPRARRTVVAAVSALASHEVGAQALRPGDALCVALVDDARIAELNERWRGQAKPTNVLSFPAPPPAAVGGPRFLGDIMLAYETLEREAKAQGKPLAQHLAHLVVHGLLHLLGHDHQDDVQANLMEGLEIEILAGMGIADPYAAGVDGLR